MDPIGPPSLAASAPALLRVRQRRRERERGRDRAGEDLEGVTERNYKIGGVILSSSATVTASSSTTFLAVISAAILVQVTTSRNSRPSYHAFFLTLGDNTTAAAHLRTLTACPHSAGTPANSAAADYVLSALSSYSLPAHSAPYDVLLSHPLHRSLALPPSSSAPATPFDLVQQPSPGDPSAASGTHINPRKPSGSSEKRCSGPPHRSHAERALGARHGDGCHGTRSIERERRRGEGEGERGLNGGRWRRARRGRAGPR